MYSRPGARAVVLSGIVTMLCVGGLDRDSHAEGPGDDAKAVNTAPPVEPKPLSDATKRGLAYLVSQQHDNGGWGQGGGWRRNLQGGGRHEGNAVSDPPDLGSTCIAILALIRAGNDAQTGPYADNVARAVRFICGQVDRSDSDSLYVTDVRDTQLQQKIGPYVDTFLAGWVLSELKGRMPSEDAEQHVLAALDKTIGKIERNQRQDGTFAGNTGWASVLSQGLCSRFLNRAAQQKVAVNADVLRRDYEQTIAALDRRTGDFKSLPAETASLRTGRVASSEKPISDAGGSDAGVQLYGTATGASRIAVYYDTNRQAEVAARKTLMNKAASVGEKQKAQDELARIDEIRTAQQTAVEGIARRLGDKRFVAGFGNNGGEEFLSYMNISEMLVAQGGDVWEQWDQSITSILQQVQNRDGSWSGHHCITGRTFCTATALLTLMADRAPVPAAEQSEAPERTEAGE